MPTFGLSERQILADKYISWTASLIRQAQRLEARGEDASNLYRMAEASKIKADLVLG